MVPEDDVDTEDHPSGSVLFRKHNNNMNSVTPASSFQSPVIRDQSPVKECFNQSKEQREVKNKDENDMKNVLEVVNSLKVNITLAVHLVVY